MKAESPRRFPECPKMYRRGQQVFSRSSFPAHGPIPGPKHPPLLQDVPCGMCPSEGGLKSHFKLTFPSFFSQFSMLVFLCVSPIPTLEGGPGSGSLRRHLRLPSSLRWGNPTPPKDTSQKKSQTPCSGTKIPQEFAMRSHTQTWNRAASPIWPWHRRCLPDILHPTLETPGKLFPGQAMHSLDGNAQKSVLRWVQGFLQSHTGSRVVVSTPYLGGLHPLPAPRQQHQSKMGCEDSAGQCLTTPGLVTITVPAPGDSAPPAEFTQLLSLSQSWRRPWRSSCARCWSVLSPR